MNPLPDYRPSKYDLLKPGKYTFRITEQPQKKRFGKATGIILQFSAISSEGEMENSSCLIWPWDDEYRILKDEIIKSDEESDWVGKSFLGEIEVGPHPTKDNQDQQKIINIKPFPTKDTTPPPEEEGDPGPGEEDVGGEDDSDVPF